MIKSWKKITEVVFFYFRQLFDWVRHGTWCVFLTRFCFRNEIGESPWLRHNRACDFVGFFDHSLPNFWVRRWPSPKVDLSHTAKTRGSQDAGQGEYRGNATDRTDPTASCQLKLLGDQGRMSQHHDTMILTYGRRTRPNKRMILITKNESFSK